MWRFEHIDVLWWWILIPLFLLGIYWITQQKNKRLQKLGHPEKIKSLMTNSPQQTLVSRTIWLVAIGCIVLAMANLQSGTEEESVVNKGSDVIIALDLSNSMLAKDIAPDRIQRSKKFLTDLVSKFSGDRVAFIVFAGRAYIQMPFTTDYGAFEMHLRSVHTDMIPTQGTALGEAIQVAESMQGADKNQEKILVLLSDGEDHDSKAVQIAKSASNQKLTIHTIGVGTTKGAPIPEISRGGISYKKDNLGHQVLSRLNEDILRDIASAGGGKYFNISDDKKAIREIQRSVKWAASGSGDEKVYTRYKNYFQWFLFPAIILLMLELASIHLLSFRNRNLSILLVLVTLFLLFSCKKSDDYTKAYRHFQNADFGQAIEGYLLLAVKDSSDIMYYNLGATYLSSQQIDSATKYLNIASSMTVDSSIKAYALFNQGCIAYQNQDYKSAADAFTNSLRYIPNNYRAQYNLSLALLHLPPQDQNQDQQDQDQDQNQDQDQDQKNNDEKDGDEKNDSSNSDENKDKSDQEKQNDQKKNDESKDSSSPPKEQKGKLTQQDVQKLFQALDQQEKAVQKRVFKQQGEQSSTPYVEKDW